ncbi:hypothetical protein ZEAMMB73_Zm00001d020817 [Zea mays]|uniref:Nucleotide-diphospho-sugar transferase domain-containing protein n=2 Tax=Zea mays TaxID=4577 RepID=A0A1D6I6E2_MAIZE|nr:hypothetical protein ZEAMMB73_Zm00001d020817 [Zea mays]
MVNDDHAEGMVVQTRDDILNIGPLLVLGPRPSPLLHGVRAGPEEAFAIIADPDAGKVEIEYHRMQPNSSYCACEEVAGDEEEDRGLASVMLRAATVDDRTVNPLKHVTAYADMSVSSNAVFGDDPDDMDNFPNRPTRASSNVTPNSRTIAMTKAWHRARERFLGKNQHPVFDAIKKGLVTVSPTSALQYMDPTFVAGFCSYDRTSASAE